MRRRRLAGLAVSVGLHLALIHSVSLSYSVSLTPGLKQEHQGFEVNSQG